ncbi:MAG TPA: site-specific DNA-methyltransferase [Lachnospiraceae bacterium]|nr:site-specific DNA-methyltransferase [Lachnospiraceae bacterium]
MTNLNGQTLDIVAENVKKLRELFPEIVTEDKIDFDRLQDVLGNYIERNEESYRFTWYGKSDAFRKSQIPSTGTLRPCPDENESKNWDTTKNLYIEGDNLEVLKLLQKSYGGRVKMIYIDPPYNKDKDFVYPDKWSDPIKEYKRITGQLDDEGNATTSDDESEGGRHTRWLNMMYPRLRLARNLLKEDGVIFISIDDNEIANLTRLCNDVFGEENYINTVSVNMKNIAGASGGGEDKRLKKNIEYLLVYSKNYVDLNQFNNAYEYTEIGELVQKYKEENVSWKYTTILVDDGNKEYIGSTVDGDGNEIKIYRRANAVTKPVSQVSREEGIDESEVYNKYAKRIFQTAMPQSSIRPRVMQKVNEIGFECDIHSIEYVPKTGKNKGVLYEQFYKGDSFRLFAWLSDVSEEKNGKLYKKDLQGTFWDYVGETKNLTKEGGIPYPNGKKPVAFLKRMLGMQTDKKSIIVDFFSGSASTAHAIMQLNSEDSGNRKYIMVQLPENMDELYKQADSTTKKDIQEQIDLLDSIQKSHIISELGKERIRRAGESIKAELKEKYDTYMQNQESLIPSDEPAPMNPEDLDIGFKVFKLDTSNLKRWSVDVGDDFYNLNKDEQNAILAEKLGFEVNNFVEGRSELDMVYEIMLKYGLDLSHPIEKYNFDGKNVYNICMGGLIICLDSGLNEKLADDIVGLVNEIEPKTVRVVVKDLSFINDSGKTNFKETLKTGINLYFAKEADKANKENQFEFITI